MSLKFSFPPVRAGTLSREWKTSADPTGCGQLILNTWLVSVPISFTLHAPLSNSKFSTCRQRFCVFMFDCEMHHGGKKGLECECIRCCLNPSRRLGRLGTGTPSRWWRLHRSIYIVVSWPMLKTSWGISRARRRREDSRQILTSSRWLISATERSRASWSRSLQGAQLSSHQEDPQTFKYSWDESQPRGRLAAVWAGFPWRFTEQSVVKPVRNPHAERVKSFRAVLKTMIQHPIVNHSGSQNWNWLQSTRMTLSTYCNLIFRPMIRSPRGKKRLNSPGVFFSCTQIVALWWTGDLSRVSICLWPVTAGRLSSWRTGYWIGWIVVLIVSGSYISRTSTVLPACLEIQFELIANYISGLLIVHKRWETATVWDYDNYQD